MLFVIIAKLILQHIALKGLRAYTTTCLKKNNMSIETALERQKQITVERNNDGKIRFGNFTFDPDVSRNELLMSSFYMSILSSLLSIKVLGDLWLVSNPCSRRFLVIP